MTLIPEDSQTFTQIITAGSQDRLAIADAIYEDGSRGTALCIVGQAEPGAATATLIPVARLLAPTLRPRTDRILALSGETETLHGDQHSHQTDDAQPPSLPPEDQGAQAVGHPHQAQPVQRPTSPVSPTRGES